ncbi:hypothetical protein Naga_101519g2 [Nannochloropsis gaditana]|uniref:Transmembrane protein n=1 Tax=Nannochloropsis gaditana TaxID=72520 RepID=W7T9N5_9STRA|nr:hypothetical protein Naga_101519g2 [Nannochloropsis gaditana]
MPCRYIPLDWDAEGVRSSRFVFLRFFPGVRVVPCPHGLSRRSGLASTLVFSFSSPYKMLWSFVMFARVTCLRKMIPSRCIVFFGTFALALFLKRCLRDLGRRPTHMVFLSTVSAI